MPQTYMRPSVSTSPESKVQDFARNLPDQDGPYPNTMQYFHGNERGDTDRRFGDESYLNEDPVFFRDRDHLEFDNSAKDLYNFAAKETDPEKKKDAVQRLRRYEMWRQGRNEQPYEYIKQEKRKEHVKTFDRGNGLNYAKMFQAGPDHAHEHMTEEKSKAWVNAFYGEENATDQKRQALLAGLISEWSQIPVEQIDKNYPAYRQAFMAEIGVQGQVDDAKAFTESSRWLKRRTEQAEKRSTVIERMAEIIDRSIIQGKGSMETLKSSTDELLAEFGEDAINRETLSHVVQKSWASKVRQYAPFMQQSRRMYETAKAAIDGGGESFDSERELGSIVEMDSKERQRLFYLIYKMAEQEAGEHDGGFVDKVWESFSRGLETHIEDIDDAGLEVSNRIVRTLIPDSSVTPQERGLRDAGRKLRVTEKEVRQDLRSIKGIVRSIESDNGAIQGIYDAASSLPFTITAAIPGGGGVALNALSMSSQNDIELRHKHPEMDADTRWRIASSGGVVQSLIERASFKAVVTPFPKLQGAFNKIGIRGTAGTLASRIGGGFAVEYGEEAFQEITVPVIQDIAGIFNEEIPDVTKEEWEHHTRIFRGDARTAWAVLPLAVIMGGGSTAIDRIGAGKAREFLGRADAIWLAGVTQEEAQAISTTKDPLKAQKMLLSAVEAKTDEELNENKKQAIDDGAENRLVEQYVEEHGTKEEKATLRAETALTNFENKFYPSVKQSEDGRYEVRYPELHNKPSEFFETEAEAGAARDAILDDMGEQDIREMELSEANIKAMQLAKESLEDSHEGAEIKVSKKADITLEKAVEQGIATVEQLMERVNIFAVSQGKANTMTWNEAKAKYTLPGQVMLKQKVRGYVARLTRGAGVQTLYEEGSEGYIREMMQNEIVTEDFLTFHLRQYEQDTGEQLFQHKDKQSSQEVVEAFSKLSQAHVWNSRGDERMNPKLGALIDLLRQFFKAILQTAENLLALKKKGLLDQEFEKHLDRAIGLDEDQLLENQRRQHEQDMLEEMSDPHTEIQVMMKGQLMRPSDMKKGDPMYGEIKDLYDHFRKESGSKKTKDGKKRVSSAGASALFAKKSEGVSLDELREKLNEQGFEFDTPADMLEALDLSLRGMKQFPTVDPGAVEDMRQGRTFSIKADNVNLRMLENNTTIELLKIESKKKGEGFAQKAMKKLTAYADQNGKIVTLSPTDEFGANKNRLIKLYKEHGFVENKGRNQDYEISGAMYRKPSTSTFSIGNTQVAPNEKTRTFPTKDGGLIGPASFSISAYHGTPHKVDKFSTDNIGTGEGAQAYGWGLYFTDTEDIARGYRDTLSKNNGGTTIFDRKTGKELAHYSMSQMPTDARSIAAWHVSRQSSGPKTDFTNALASAIKFDVDSDVIEILREWSKMDVFSGARNGSLYTVELNAERDELLDWDKPLSEQSEKVIEYLKNNPLMKDTPSGRQPVIDFDDLVDMDGGAAYVNSIGKYFGPTHRGNQKASEWLSSIGIKGIRYLDGNSRSDGEGSYNYVIFNDSDITITAENGEKVETSFSLAQAEDPVVAKIQSLMRDPDTRVALYKVIQQRLERVRTEIATREIKSIMSDKESDDRVAIMDGIAQLQALVSALPIEIRGKVGGWRKIASYKTTRGVNNFLKNRLEKIDGLMEKHIRDEYIERIDKLIERATPKKGNAKVAKGKITPEGHAELDEIVKVVEMSPAEVADAVNTAELDLSRAESIDDTDEREDAIIKANAAIGRLSTFGNLKSKSDPMSALGAQEAHAEIDHLVTEGRSRYMLHLVAQKEHRQGLKRSALEVITGGRGRKLRAERLKDGEEGRRKSWLKQEHARNVSFEMMLNGLSRMDKDSATLDSWLNQYFGQAVHKATHGEAIAANRKKVELLQVVAAIYGVDTESVGWQGRVEDVMASMSERHADSGIFIEEQAGKQVLRSYRAEVEAIVAGQLDVIHSGYGWVQLSKKEIAQFKALLAADNSKKKGQPKQNFEITRKTDGVVTEQYMSQDSAMFLSMMWRQVGLRPAMEAHGYNEKVMKKFEKFLTRESKLLRTWMFRQYDLNHDYFNKTFKKMFGVNLVKVKGYSPAKSIHGGRQVKDMIDASHGKQSTTPGMAMERIQHQAEPRYDVGAVQAYLQHVDSTEHFVHWAEPVAELRSVFMDKDVREAILDHHGPELYAELIERIDMFADGGNMMAKTNRFADHLRKTFTVAKLAFNWGVFLKQLTSLPAYGFDMPVKDFLKYEAEFFSDMNGNWKKMWELPYTQNRFDAGYDRDVMAVINSVSKRKGKFAKAAEWGMITGRAGDIIPVIVGGYAAYRYHYEKAKAEGKTDAQAEVIGVLQFEMSTDRAQQSGNIKDQSSYGLGGSLFRVFTMFQTSPRQYYANMMEAILDMKAGRKGAGKRAAKAAFIAHVVLPSLFYWMSAGTRNLFRAEGDRDDLDELLKGWMKSMALGPFSGVFLWGQIGSEMASGYEYSMPVFEFGKESMDASSKLGRMWKAGMDDDDATQIESKDVIGFLDNIARTGSLAIGGGATWYDIGTRASKSFGFTQDRVERIMMSEVDGIVLDLGKTQAEIYEEKLPDKDEFPDEYEETRDLRYEKLAEEYSKIKAENPSLWPEIAEKLRKKNKLPEAVEDLMD